MRKIILFVAGMFLFLAISGCSNANTEPQEALNEDTIEVVNEGTDLNDTLGETTVDTLETAE